MNPKINHKKFKEELLTYMKIYWNKTIYNLKNRLKTIILWIISCKISIQKICWNLLTMPDNFF